MVFEHGQPCFFEDLCKVTELTCPTHKLPSAYREDADSDHSFILYLYLLSILPAAEEIHVI